MFFFFFQAEDGIRNYYVTGVQTCALPISHAGLTALTLVAITDGPVQAGKASSGEALDMAELVATAERAAPALEDLIQSLLADLGQVASEREAEYS